MATTTKRRKIGSEYAPREIRENTKARRAWLAARVEEIKAQPNRDAKIVGVGQLQEVSIYEVTEVAARMQTRGTCQGCGNDVAVQRGRTAKHGYKRPGDGYLVGSCMGADAKPAEKAQDITERMMEALTEQADEKDAKAEEKDRIATRHAIEARGLSFETDREAWSAAMDARREAEKDARNLRWVAKQERAYVDHLRVTAVAAYGQPFREVPVA